MLIITDKKTEELCDNCRKKFKYELSPQIPGFREREYLYCPWCKSKLDSSMTWDYINIERIEENESK